MDDGGALDFTGRKQQIPIRRQPTMAELAWACLFLSSPRSGGITGSAIHVDGGQFMLG
jgi:enoyl-[acyl-carrier-protein] reductase (NADH)